MGIVQGRQRSGFAATAAGCFSRRSAVVEHRHLSSQRRMHVPAGACDCPACSRGVSIVGEIRTRHEQVAALEDWGAGAGPQYGACAEGRAPGAPKVAALEG
jgi:hypothetical protein